MIIITAPEDGRIMLELYDVHGQLVRKISESWMRKGQSQQTEVSRAGLSAGVYWLRASTSSKQLQYKLLIQ